MALYPLKVFPSGPVFLDAGDDCLTVANLLETINYAEDFCLALDFDPYFIAKLMEAGFLVMSSRFPDSEESEEAGQIILLPKHHLLRSCLFFHELHVKKSVRRFLSQYELRFDTDFDRITENCVRIHGSGWLTEPFLQSIRQIRESQDMPVRPVSFALYRDEKLAAGEFGIISGKVYTSYSGYYEESNAGSVQIILTAKYLEKAGFSFWDLGMPLDYKLTFGAREITRKEFMELFQNASV